MQTYGKSVDWKWFPKKGFLREHFIASSGLKFLKTKCFKVKSEHLLKAKHVRHYFESNGVLNSGVRLTCIMNSFSNVFTQRKAKREWWNKIIIHYKKGQILQSVTIEKEYVNSAICQKYNRSY